MAEFDCDSQIISIEMFLKYGKTALFKPEKPIGISSFVMYIKQDHKLIVD